MEMTKEEAINILNRDDNSMRKGYFCINDFLAIEVLKSQEPCENCISREAVIEVLNKMDRYVADELILCDTNNKFPQNEVFVVDDVYEQIAEQLPSITPQSKVGQWIYDKTIENWRCSECNETPKTMGYVGTADFMAEHFRFCNHCGIKMEVEEC